MDAVTGSGRSAAVQEAIERLLVEADVAYRILRHDPVRTAEDAAAARGLPLSHGVKTLVLRVDDGFLLLALPADLSLSSRALRRGLGARRTRFARREELARLTGLEPGGVPPFGRPVFELDLVADSSLAEDREVAFTPGRRDRSIVLAAADWRRTARPRFAGLTDREAGE